MGMAGVDGSIAGEVMNDGTLDDVLEGVPDDGDVDDVLADMADAAPGAQLLC